MYDIAIIGAGVIGAVMARELSKYNVKCVILEKNSDVALGVTNVNSGIVHSGYDCVPGTDMAELVKHGNELFPALCDELAVFYKRIGSFACAFSPDETKELKRQYRNGKRLGIPGLELLKGKKIRKREPALNPAVTAALYSPGTGISNPWELAIACTENAVENGVDLKLNCHVHSIKKTDSHFYISYDKKYVRTRAVINCAGILADDVAAMIIAMPDFKIQPAKADFLLRKKKECNEVSSVIFSAAFSPMEGTILVPTEGENILVGSGKEKLKEDPRDLLSFKGLFPDSDRGDFVIGESEIEGFFNVGGISFSGLSASPAIARKVSDKVLNFLKRKGENDSFNPFRKPRPAMGEGNIVCPCNQVSEEEIVDAIRRKGGALSVGAILRRLRPHVKPCKEELCNSAITAIITREVLTDPMDLGLKKDDYFNRF